LRPGGFPGSVSNNRAHAEVSAQTLKCGVGPSDPAERLKLVPFPDLYENPVFLQPLNSYHSRRNEFGYFCCTVPALKRGARSGNAVMVLIILLLIALLSGCGHPKQAHVSVPPPPPAAAGELPAPRPPSETAPSEEAEAPGKPENNEADLAEPTIPADAEPIVTETGFASWYGPPYHNRRGSNGEVYNMHAMTAAHRTFPLGSIVRVTNVKTGNHALVRITDRGPFIPGRVLDLSLAAAHKLDVWQPGASAD
jgi:hypothetical protein